MTKAILIYGTRNTGKTTANNNLYDYYTSEEGRKAKVLFKLTEHTDISAILEYEVNNEKN